MARTALTIFLCAGTAQALAQRPEPSRYDVDYPTVAYGAKPQDNEVARLQARLDRREVELTWRPGRGYIDSLLESLHIDPSSQVLVFSKTSLQIQGISRQTPRAIYFNDDTYVAWVQNSDLIELATMDSQRGAVFYTFPNEAGSQPKMQREMARCINCHDTFSLSGGGIPRFLFLSADGKRTSIDTNDRTPIADRWGGWYITGELTGQSHLGVGHPKSLSTHFPTEPYLTDKSDVVALLVLEHQLHVKNLITRLSFKSRSFLAQDGTTSLAEGSLHTRQRIEAMIEQLVQTLLFVDAAGLAAPVRGDAGFDRWFQARGPFDGKGRSLRELDLHTRLFKYRMSYVVYSEGFDALPRELRAVIFRRLGQVLSGADQSPPFAHLGPEERAAILEILTATKPQFVALSRAAD